MSERGSITIWLLGLCVCLLFLGGLSVDLWRVMNVRRELVSLADGAAVHGATAVDEAAFRASGAVRVDPAAARRVALAYLAPRLPADAAAQVRTSPQTVRVTLQRTVPLSLLGALMPDERLRVAVAAEVTPQRRT